MNKIFFLFFVFAAKLVWAQGLDFDYKYTQLKNLVLQAEARGLPSSLYLNTTKQNELYKAYTSSSENYNLAIQQLSEKVASDMQIGRVSPESLGERVRIKPKVFTAKVAVNNYINGQISLADAIQAIEPKNYLYRSEVQLISYLNDVVNAGSDYVPTNLNFSTVSTKRQNPDLVHYLRSRLDLLGYRNSVNNGNFDSELDSIVKLYQDDHKLQADGVVGSGTWGYLNRSIPQMIRQLAVNIDRTRWLADAFPAERVFVNLASQQFTYFQNNNVSMAFRNINGRTDRQTPMMVDMIKNVVLNPTWTVPYSIFVKDKLPKIKEDPGYIIQMKMRLFDDITGLETDPYSVDWSQVDASNLHYTLIQKPGSHNALGFIKFPLQNPYAIYLHDTNDRHLFTESNRLLSSGCVRLQYPFEFAEKILNDPKWTASSLRDASEYSPYQAEDQTWLKMKKSVAVYLFYMTVFKTNDGRIVALPDLYETDKAMLQKN